MAVKQFYAEETIYYTDSLNGNFDDKVLATANAVASGGGGGTLIAVATIDEQLDAIILDKTYSDIESAIIAKTPVYMYTELGGHSLVPIITATHDSNGYSVVVSQFHGEPITFYSETADGVLVYSD